MQTTSLLFLMIFLPAFVFLMFFIKNNKIRNFIILGFSLVFYLINDFKYFVLLILVITITFLFAKRVKNNKLLYCSYILIVLLLLLFFKFGNYIVESIENVQLLMPLGISYYLFESISYISDCYRSKYDYCNNFFEVATYISFFPCVSCGPIQRFDNFKEYYINKKEISYDSIGEGFKRFILGLAKKIIIADQIGYLVNVVYSEETTLTTPLAWAGAICFVLQLYYDFSGCSDVAIGVAKMIGYKLNENFDHPFISKSTSEFWRRWHISLGVWFKDYVYIPLGGNRVSKTRLVINIMLVWVLTGIWHGSNINYILWGIVLGVFINVEKLFKLKYPKYLGIIITNLIFVLSMVLFRSPSLDYALSVYKNIFMWSGFSYAYYKLLGILYLWPFIAIAILFLIPWVIKFIQSKPIVYDIFIVCSLIFSILFMLGGSQLTFIYAGF